MVFVKDGEIVAPGEPLCVEEEFEPGENVKKHNDGILASIISGVVKFDHSKRIVHVKPLKKVEEIKVGDTVLAQVKEVQDKIAIVNVISANGSALKHPKTAVILPSKRMRGSLEEYVGIGDLVIGMVVTCFTGIIGLSIWRPNLGVILGVCNKCSGMLMKSGRTLVCTRCGEKQKRKIVPYYGNLERLASMLR